MAVQMIWQLMKLSLFFLGLCDRTLKWKSDYQEKEEHWPTEEEENPTVLGSFLGCLFVGGFVRFCE